MVYIFAAFPAPMQLLPPECIRVIHSLPSPLTDSPWKGEMAEAGWTLYFPRLVSLYLSVLPRVSDTEETRRGGHGPRGLNPRRCQCRGYLKISR